MALSVVGLPLTAPSRGENGKAGDATTSGTTVANITQQNYFADVVTRVVLPMFKACNRPFVLVFWSRDPNDTQHNQGDNPNRLTRGINGPTSLVSIKNADDDLGRIQKGLAELGLADTTDIVITADHGFATISKGSNTSPAAQASWADVPQGLLPLGFVAIDVATALRMPLYDPDAKNAPVALNSHSSRVNGLIGRDPNHLDCRGRRQRRLAPDLSAKE